jgi:hypothetical protein
VKLPTTDEVYRSWNKFAVGDMFFQIPKLFIGPGL